MTVQEQYQQLEADIRGYNPSANLERIHDAFAYANMAHSGQKRKSGEPYIIHPIAVARIVAGELRLDSESIEAALLHDVIEDTPATHEDIARLFSDKIADLVEGVSKLTRMQYAMTMEEEQMENFRKMLFAMSKDIRVILIKIADRLHNMRTMDYQKPEKQRQKSFETMEIYAPIAHRLGMQKIKWELEDLSLKYLDPVGYQEIAYKMEEELPRHEVMMQQMQARIYNRLCAMEIPGEVFYRMKHPYSIYRKTIMRGRTLDEIYDMFAFRVVVDTVQHCYFTLGAIHDLFTPIQDRFKDYIGNPKPNGYQSLHTAVMGDRGYPIEVQIRTREMHEEAEYGIAAHWLYKQNGVGTGTEERYEWVRRLLENQDGADAEEYMHSLKIDLFNDQVLAFTPKGEVRTFPVGATPIDFAYAIHSEVGDHMTGAKINGRLVPLGTPLKSGDVVEILTSKSSRGPSRDWMRIAKSSDARSKIRQWLRKNRRDEIISYGKSAFESELRQFGLRPRDLSPEILNFLLRNTSYHTMDDLYAAIGCGGFTAQKAVMKIDGELKRNQREKEKENLNNNLINNNLKDDKKSEADIRGWSRRASDDTKENLKNKNNNNKYYKNTGSQNQEIIVEGIDNCLIKFSRCCAPVPGDPIIGFITRGRGVSVHRADCPNASEEKQMETPGRWIPVSWGENVNDSYPASLEAVCKDRNNLALDITTALSNAKTSLRGVSVRATDDEYAICHLDLRIRDADELNKIMKKLYQISGVLNVTRPAG